MRSVESGICPIANLIQDTSLKFSIDFNSCLTYRSAVGTTVLPVIADEHPYDNVRSYAVYGSRQQASLAIIAPALTLATVHCRRARIPRCIYASL